jgi:GNAT superfamily N-acetyltransferase
MSEIQNTNKIQVRSPEPGDFLRVAALLAELGRPALTPETSDAVQTVYERHLADPETASLVAELDGEIVGFVSLVYREHLNYVHPQGWIPDLIVTESARGQGAARALLERAFEQAQARGCDWVRLESGYHRTAAHQAYGAVGMSNDGYYFTKPVGNL